METILDAVLKWLTQTLVLDGFLNPLLGSLNDSISNGEIFRLLQMEVLFDAMRSIGFALFGLITVWQLFKSLFGFAGVEADEPVKIVLRALIMGLALGFSKDILMLGTDLAAGISDGLLLSLGGTAPTWDTTGSAILAALMSPAVKIVYIVLGIWLMLKIVGIYIRMIERIVLSAFLIIGAPLAFACGAAQPTRGFLSGFIKVYVGNLLLQILQYMGVAILFQSLLASGLPGSLFDFFVTIAVVKVLGKLEDIVRDMSIGVGVGRDMGGVMQKIQGAVHTGSFVMQGIRAIK